MGLERFGNLIRAGRITAGMSQRQLAAMLSVCPSSVSKWENGVCFPDPGLLSALADALSVPETELLLCRESPEHREGGEKSGTGFCWAGVLLKEDLTVLSVLDCAEITDVGLQRSVRRGEKELSYATWIELRSADPDFPEKLSMALADGVYAELVGSGSGEGGAETLCCCIMKGNVVCYSPGDRQAMRRLTAMLAENGLVGSRELNPFRVFGRNGKGNGHGRNG